MDSGIQFVLFTFFLGFLELIQLNIRTPIHFVHYSFKLNIFIYYIILIFNFIFHS